MPLHFGYGSNISRVKLLGNLHRAHFGLPVYDPLDAGVAARLADHAFELRALNGTANISAEPGGEVWGALYDLTEAQYARIWDYEDRALAAEKRVQVQAGGETVEARTWVFASDPTVHAASYYIELIIETARQRPGFPAEYIERVFVPYLSRERFRKP